MLTTRTRPRYSRAPELIAESVAYSLVRGCRKRKARFLPCLESLEDRTLLSLSQFLVSDPGTEAIVSVIPPSDGQSQNNGPVEIALDSDLVFLANNVDSSEFSALDRIESPLLRLASRHLQGDSLGSEEGRLGAQTFSGAAYGDHFLHDGARPLVDVFVASVDAAIPFLEGIGMEITAVADTDAWQIVEGFLPVDSILSAAHAPGLSVLSSSERPSRDSDFADDAGASSSGTEAQGAATNQWEAVSFSDQLRRVLLVDGSDPNIDGNIEFGVMSDSANQISGGIAASQATGDLPTGAGRITILADNNNSDIDEGRAMAELIYDIAPNYNFIFHEADGGRVDFANGYDELRAAGADIITDDFSYYSEPPFQDGVIANATEAVYSTHGVLTFGSAGNGNNAGYRNGWVQSSGNFHNFGGGDQTINVALGANETLSVQLHWNQAWGSAATDIDMELWNAALNTKVADSNTNNIGGNPTDFISFTNGPAAANYHLAFRYVSGTSPTGLVLQMYGNGDNDDDFTDPYVLNEPHVAGNHAGSFNFAMGAVFWNTPNTIEGFSSRGPNIIYFSDGGTPLANPTTIQVPKFTAADGVATTLPGFTNLNPFFGTSAASPNAAAIAGLLFDAAERRLTYTETLNIFADTAIGTGTGTWDGTHGQGRINALGAGLVANGMLSNTHYLELNPFGNASLTTTLSGDTNMDRIAFAPDNSGTTTISVTNGASAIDPGFILWDNEAGTFLEIDYNDGTGDDAFISRSLSFWNLYQAQVFTEAMIGSSAESYTINVNATDQTTVALTLDANGDASSSSTLGDQDADYYSFVAPVTANGQLTVTLTVAAALNGVLNLYDASGNQLTRVNSGGTGTNETLTFSGIVPGATYYIRVGSSSYATAGAFTVNVNVGTSLPTSLTTAEGFAYFHRDGVSRDGNQSFGAFINGPGDIDSYLFAGDSGWSGTYTFAVGDFNNVVDPVVGVYDPVTGTLLGFDNDGGPGDDALLSLSLSSTTNYIVAVSDNSGMQTGDVSLTITAPSSSSGQTINLDSYGDGGISGTLDFVEDTDFYNFTTPAASSGSGQVIVIPQVGTLDLAVAVFDAAGTEVARDIFSAAGDSAVVNLSGLAASTQYFLSVLPDRYSTSGAFRVEVDLDVDTGSVAGRKFEDINGNGILDAGEFGLANWLIYVDDNNNGVFDQGGIEPDDFAAGTVLDTIDPDITLSAQGTGLNSSTVTSETSGNSSTGTRLFGNDGTTTVDFWQEGTREFRADFDTPVSTVSLDFISDDSSDIGEINAFDVNGTLLANYTTAVLGTGQVETMTIFRAQRDIAFIVAYASGGDAGFLDNLVVSGGGIGERFDVTDAAGGYLIPALELGQNHVVREIPQPGYVQTGPATGFHTASPTLTTPNVVGLNFGNQLLDLDDQIAEAIATGGANTTSSGTISHPYDVDLFAVTTNYPGQVIAFDIDRPAGTLDSILRVFNGAGTQLAINDDGPNPNEGPSTESYLEFAFATQGTYYIGVSNFNNNGYSVVTGFGDTAGSTTGPYNLVMTDVTPDPDDQIGEAVPVAIGSSTATDIDVPTDTDMYSVNVAAGERVQFDIDTFGSGLDSVLRLFDGLGNELSVNDDGFNSGGFPEGSLVDSFIDFTFATAGTYYVGVSGFSNFGYDPLAGTGDDLFSSTGTYTLNITNPPVVAGSGAAQTYREDRPPQVLDTSTLVSDPDSGDFNGGFIDINLVGGDPTDEVLILEIFGVSLSGANISVDGALVGTFASDGFGGLDINLTTADATPTRISSLLRAVAFVSAENAPTPTRFVEMILHDGDGGISDAFVKQVDVQAEPDRPQIASLGGPVTFIEDAGPIDLTATGTLFDPDLHPDWNGARLNVRVSRNLDSFDRLTIRNDGMGAGQIGVVGTGVFYEGTQIGTFNGGVGTTRLQINFIAGSTTASIQALIRAIQFENLIDLPVVASKDVRFELTDPQNFANLAIPNGIMTVNMQGTNDLPTIAGISATPVTYNEGGAPRTVGTGGTISDADYNGTGFLRVSIVAGGEANDRLGVLHQGLGTNQVGVSGNQIFFSGVLIATRSGGIGTNPMQMNFNSNATRTGAQAVMRLVQYSSVSEDPSTVQRQLDFLFNDGDGADSNVLSAFVNVNATNDPSVIANFGADVNTTTGTNVRVSNLVNITDVDSPDFAGGLFRATISSGQQAGDTLSLFNDATVTTVGANVFYLGTLIGTLSTNATSLTVVLNASATATMVQRLGRNLEFSAALAGTRAIRYQVLDGDGGNTSTPDKNVNVS